MAKRLCSALVLAAISIGILLFPWAGNYQSPLMWARMDRDPSQPVDVFLIGATADLGNDGTFLTTTYLPEDREWQEKLLNLQEGVYSSVGSIYAPSASTIWRTPPVGHGSIRPITMCGLHFSGTFSTKIRGVPLFWQGTLKGPIWGSGSWRNSLMTPYCNPSW